MVSGASFWLTVRAHAVSERSSLCADSLSDAIKEKKKKKQPPRVTKVPSVLIFTCLQPILHPVDSNILVPLLSLQAKCTNRTQKHLRVKKKKKAAHFPEVTKKWMCLCGNLSSMHQVLCVPACKEPEFSGHR